MLEVVHTNDRAAGSVRLRGELDVSSVDQCRLYLQQLLADLPAVTIDLGELSGVDTAGSGMLVGLGIRARRECRELRVLRPSRSLRDLFDQAGLVEVVADRATVRT